MKWVKVNNRTVKVQKIPTTYEIIMVTKRVYNNILLVNVISIIAKTSLKIEDVDSKGVKGVHGSMLG